MITWMAYATTVTLLLLIAAMLLDRPLQARGWPSRFVWGSALALMSASPFLYMAAHAATAALSPAPTVSLSAAAIAVPSIPEAPITAAPIGTLPSIPPSEKLERLALLVAIGGPLAMLLALGVESARLARARRRWRVATVDGVAVMVSKDFGPAVVGIRHPVIVIPEWSLHLLAEPRALMLAHESEHLAARDSRWIAAAFALVALTPWNPGMHWLLRRLRLAMEIDCDRRVLRLGHEPAAYGLLLLEMTSRTDRRSLLAAGLAVRRSMLRTRIENLLTPGETMRSRHILQIAAGAVLLLGACFVGPSHSPRVAATPTAGAVDSPPPLPALANAVGDSIVVDDTQLVARRAARGLPLVFHVDREASPSVTDRCPALLSDGGVHLQLQASITRTGAGQPNHGVGYYSVRPVGQYGVRQNEFLRVGCGSDGMRTDYTSLMNAARSAAVYLRLEVVLDTIQRVGSRLNLAYTDTTSTRTGTPRNRAQDVARYAWRSLGADSARVDTVSVNVRSPRGMDSLQGVTVQSARWWFYRERDLANK